jgi:hypothetical protein
MNVSRVVLLLSIVLGVSVQASFGQALRNGLGDASSIVTPYRSLTSTGNPNEIGNFSGSSVSQDTGAFATRHLRSDSSGIGGSFLGTTNVTAESSPARIGRIPVSTVRALIPTSGANFAPTGLYSESINRPVSSALHESGPDISNDWNATHPLLNSGFTPGSSIDFFAGHKKPRGSSTFSNTTGTPAFDNF